MSGLEQATLTSEIQRSLIETGYSALPAPLQVGEISLDLESVFSGPVNRLDLVVIVNHPDTREEGSRIYWQVQRLARALEAAGSRRTITVIVINGIADNRLLADLQTVARVLAVDRSLPVRRLIAPLLHLEVPAARQGSLDGVSQVRATVKGRYRTPLLEMVESAGDGPSSVNTTYATWIDGAFSTGRLRHE